MKLQDIFSTRAIAIGFGAALLLASSAGAQEIENKNWDDGSAAVPFTQPAPAQRADNFNVASTNPDAVQSMAMASKPEATQETVVTTLGPVEQWLMAFLFICLALMITYASVEARRRHRNIDARNRHAAEQLPPNGPSLAR
jgi:hypothetical protein